MGGHRSVRLGAVGASQGFPGLAPVMVYIGPVFVRRCPVPLSSCDEQDAPRYWQSYFAEMMAYMVQSKLRVRLGTITKLCPEFLDRHNITSWKVLAQSALNPGKQTQSRQGDPILFLP